VEATKHKNLFLGPSTKSVKYELCVQSLDANICTLFHQLKKNHRWYSKTFSKLAVEADFEAAEKQNLQQALNSHDAKFSNKHLSNSKRINMSKAMKKILQHEEYSILKIFCWS
jgi:predicted DNA binding CopG/RHH family protein